MRNKFIKLFTCLFMVFGLTGCELLFTVAPDNTNTSTTSTSSTSTGSTSVIEPVTSVEVNPQTLALAVGDTYTISARCLPENSIQGVTFKSSKLNVCKVDADTGEVTALGVGTAKIYVTSKANSRIENFCTVTVAEQVIKATSIALDKTSLSLTYGATSILHATLTPTNATGGVKWGSTDNSVATVSSTGKVTAVGFGNATIRAIAASDSNVFAECAVHVEQIHVTSVSLDKTTLDVSTGSETTLKATVLPSNADDKTLTWTSSNEEYATVNNGVVKCLKEGSVTITATSNDNKSLKASCVFNITDVHPTSISLSKTSVNVSIDTSYTVTVNFVPDNTSNKDVIWTSTDTSIAEVDNGVITGRAIGNCLVKAKTVDGGLVATCNVVVSSLAKVEMKYNYEDLTNQSLYRIDSIPSLGHPKMIVIPVWMTDSSNYIPTTKKAAIRQDIQTAYFGTNAETGWRSVKTYYEEESFGKLTLDGIVTDWYECGYSSSSCGSSQTNTIVSNAVSWFKNNHQDTYADYDTNGDGYLDAVCLIYAAPDYGTSRSSNSNLWAYCFWLQQAPGTARNPVPNVFFWASYDFMYSYFHTNSCGYGGGHTNYCNIDAHTYIHEMGHIFGLDDYYDYNNGYSASGGFSMQDHNVGGHDPYSKMALNWVEPYVPTESTTITIKPLETSGDLILLSPNFQGSPFDEYILIDLYTPTGLNKFDTDHQYGGYGKGPSIAGCRVWHVDARLASVTQNSYGNLVYTLETNPNILSSKRYVHAFTNSTFVSTDDGRSSPLAKTASDTYAKYRELQLIREDYTTDERCGDWLDNSDLFVTGDTFNMTKYEKCFVYNGKLNSGVSLGYSVSFDSVTSSGATITITRG